LLFRYGVVVRESVAAEDLPGGFSAFYPALRQMEDRGWIRRGMFISGLGGSQFAVNAAVEALRALRSHAKKPATMLAAVDPANPYGSLLPWPSLPEDSGQGPHGMARVSGANVLLINGELGAFLRRGNPALKLWIPASHPERDDRSRAAARELARIALRRQSQRSGLLISEINGKPAREHFFGQYLEEAGFVLTALGYQMRRANNSTAEPEPESEDETDSYQVEQDGEST
jgi:ATP-dependent Lhr-like helicase